MGVFKLLQIFQNSPTQKNNVPDTLLSNYAGACNTLPNPLKILIPA